MAKRTKRVLLKQLSLFYIGAILFATFFANNAARAQKSFQSFSADKVTTSDGKTTREKVYAIEKAVRVETEKDGKKVTKITRVDRYLQWMLEPDDTTYMEMHTRPVTGPGTVIHLTVPTEKDYVNTFNLAPGFTEFARKLQGADVVRESLGRERVGSYDCEKLFVRVTFKGNVYTSFEWAAKELRGLVIKGQDEKGEWSAEYQNIQIGPQDPSLFDIPKGYKKKFEEPVTMELLIPKSSK